MPTHEHDVRLRQRARDLSNESRNERCCPIWRGQEPFRDSTHTSALTTNEDAN
jgi:hypothetical protein